MKCLVCNERRAPTQTLLCRKCDRGFHPIDQRGALERFIDSIIGVGRSLGLGPHSDDLL